MKKILIAFAAAGVIFNAGVAMAKESVQLTGAVFQEKEVLDKDGKSEKKLVPAGIVVPGSEVVYVISYSNSGDKAAQNLVIRNPLPEQLRYTGEATGANAQVEVTVDGGATFGSLSSLTVATADGKTRPAAAADVTGINWKIASAIKPGEKGQVSYRAVLK